MSWQQCILRHETNAFLAAGSVHLDATAPRALSGIGLGDTLAGTTDQAPVEPAQKARLSSALNAPPTVELIAGLANGPEEASEIYGAALTAIDLDSPSEHLFLRRLASSLKLDEQLVETVHETLEKE
jgi:uncharacterized membrane protein YebE (DUF533 family)